MSAARVALDLLAAGGGALLGARLGELIGATGPASHFWLAGFGLAVWATFARAGLYRREATVGPVEETAAVLRAASLAAALTLAAGAVAGIAAGSPVVWGSALLVGTMSVVTERRVVAELARLGGFRFGLRRNTLIYGSGESGQLLMKKLVKAPHFGRSLVGFVDDYAPAGTTVGCRTAQHRPEVRRVPVLGRGDDLPALIDEHDVDEVLVATPAVDLAHLRETLDSAVERPVEVGLVPGLAGVRADQIEVMEIGAVPIVRPSHPSPSTAYPVGKRLLDLTLSTLLLTLTAPAWIVAAAAIWLDSGGPVLFRQDRVGKDGKRFVMYKFRTLAADTDPYSPSTTTRDSRATRVGRILRMTGLDELPQLLNVLRGEMSLVGPRPEMPFIVEDYTELERERLRVKPGVTGVWQLSPDREGAFIHANLEYDLYYIRYRSLALDLALLLETCFFMVEMAAYTVASLARGLVGRDARGEPTETTAATEEGGESIGGRRRRPEVVIALDQRQDGGIPATWRKCLGTFLGDGRALAVVVARSNVPIMETLVREAHAGNGTGGPVPLFVPYEDRGTLFAAIEQAELVVTDLPHVASLARRREVKVVPPPTAGNGLADAEIDWNRIAGRSSSASARSKSDRSSRRTETR